jgi:HlyD family secretion protein
MMNKRLVAVMLLGVLMMVSLAGCGQILPMQAKATTDLETATVTRGLIVATVNAAGNLEPESQVALSFKGAGRVQEVLVDGGDEVTDGQVLARLETGELELQVAQAEAGLAAAQAQLAKLKAMPDEDEVAAMEAALEAAKASLQTAEGAVASARANLARVEAGPTPEEIAIAERRVEQARNALWAAQTSRDSICGRVGSGPFDAQQSDCDNAQATVQRAEEELRIAELQLQQLRRGPRDEDVAAARAQLQQALGQLASAQAQVRQAEANLARVRKGPSAEDLAAAQAQVDQARVALELARLRLDDAVLKAPFDGTVVAVNVEIGQMAVAGTPAIVLAKLEPLHVSLTIDETDIARLQVGQPAIITLDAFLGTELSGTVTEISPVASVQQGVVTYRVKVDLAPTDLPIRPGMTANVNIEVARKENALLIPNRAIRFRGGQRVVSVLRGEETVEVPIEVGLSNEEQTEVLSGLSEGDLVVTSVTPANNPLRGGFFGAPRSR